MPSFFTNCCVWLGAVLSLPTAQASEAQPQAAAGHLERLAIHSEWVQERPVDVWLPDGYAERAKAGHRYQVLYMHDGQMLFDAATTWNKQAWHVDTALDRLMKAGQVDETIVVAVWNNGKYRAAEYYPQKFLAYLPEAQRARYESQALEGRAQADDYLRFLVEELKPAIDKRYATRPEAASTFIMGSSMGGLISVYAYAEYPKVFGGAAALSTHWVGIHEANARFPLAAFDYLSRSLSPPQGRRLYMDRGTATLDALYGPAQTMIDQIVRDAGYSEDSFLTRVFEGAEHTENAWSARLEVPLRFLLHRQ